MQKVQYLGYIWYVDIDPPELFAKQCALFLTLRKRALFQRGPNPLLTYENRRRNDSGEQSPKRCKARLPANFSRPELPTNFDQVSVVVS